MNFVNLKFLSNMFEKQELANPSSATSIVNYSKNLNNEFEIE